MDSIPPLESLSSNALDLLYRIRNGAKLELHSYCFDEFDADGWYELNGKDLYDNYTGDDDLITELKPFLEWRNIFHAPGQDIEQAFLRSLVLRG
jgi:hypothetical protein